MSDIGAPTWQGHSRSVAAWAVLALCVSAVAFWHARSTLPAPHVNVRWSPDVNDQQRAGLETRFGLSHGEFRGTRTWSYELGDRTAGNLRALVASPGVEDTHGIDRGSLVPENDPGRFYGLGFALLVGFGMSTAVWLGIAAGPACIDAFGPVLRQQLLCAPLLSWVLVIFSLAYVLFFVVPAFLNADRAMAATVDLPAGGASSIGVGMDARLTIDFSRSWLEHGTPYVDGNSYPPLTTLLYAALVPMPFERAYALITVATLLSYVFVAFVFPLSIGRDTRLSPLLLLVGVTGAFSYGFRFEVERGQFDLIAMCVCCGAIVLFHHAARFRTLAYALFTLAVQLKVYPFVFVLMFVRRWRDVRENLARMALLAATSAAMLFVMGPSIFAEFVQATISKLQTGGAYSFITPYNHSIKSWVVLWAQQEATERHVWWPAQHIVALQLVLIALVLVCLGTIVAMTYRSHRDGIDADLLLGCALCAVIIPGVSHDYTLPILSGPFAALLMKYEDLIDTTTRRRWHLLAPVLVCSAAYASLMFSIVYKPSLLGHNLPTLVAMMMALAWLSVAARGVQESEALRAPDL